MPIGDQGTFRVALRPVATPAGPVVVAAGGARGPAQRTVRAVVGALAVGLPLVLGLVALTAWALAGRAVAPVEAIRAQVAEISARALGRRVPEPGGRDEIARLARTMNDMLARLDSSARRRRQSVADASHELCSPLAAALAEVDVDLAHPRSPSGSRRLRGCDRSRSACAKSSRTCSSWPEPTRPPGRHSRPVDLGDVVVSECANLRTTTGVLVDDHRVAAVEVMGDRDQLRRMVANLLTNAARHASTRIAVTLSQRDGRAELVVDDDGPGVPNDQRQRIFERFTRLDEARARDAGGAGLGLAIAKEIVDAHHGDIAVSDAQPGARFSVALPATPLSADLDGSSRHSHAART
jgi:signal transduction histidine kinase